MKMEYPCKDCANKYLGCHAKCEKYIEVKNANEEISAKIRKEKLLRGLFISMRSDSIAKVCRGRRM